MATYNTKFYDKQVTDYNNKVNKDLATQTAKVQADTQNQLQQAYIQRMQNQKELANNLAQQGIRGGASETANLNLINRYANTRNSALANQSQAIADLNATAQDNMFNYAQQMASQKAEYVQNREAEDRARQQKQADQYWQAKYSGWYSLNDLNKAFKKASTMSQKIAIKNRIGYLKQHKKKY